MDTNFKLQRNTALERIKIKCAILAAIPTGAKTENVIVALSEIIIRLALEDTDEEDTTTTGAPDSDRLR